MMESVLLPWYARSADDARHAGSMVRYRAKYCG
jgi:hypothetical protein